MIQMIFANGAAVQVGAPTEALGMGPEVDKLLQIFDPDSQIMVVAPITREGAKALAEALLKSNSVATLPGSGLVLPGADRLPLGRRH